MWKKGWIALLLVLLLIVASFPVLAAQGTYVYDDLSYLSQEEQNQLDAYAAQIQEETGVAVVLVMLDEQALPVAGDLAASLQQLCVQSGQTDAVFLAMTQTQWSLYCVGAAQTRMPQQAQEVLFDAMSAQSSWYEAMKACMDCIAAYLQPEQVQEDACVLDDGANLLTQQERETLLSDLRRITQRQACSVSVVTVDSLMGKGIEAYADDYYDQNGLGAGATYDGLVLLVDMQSRQWAISTCGTAISIFTDARLEELSEQFLPSLSTGDYAAAFTAFADGCDAILTQAHVQPGVSQQPLTGNENAVSHVSAQREALPGVWIIISAGIGIAVSLIVVGSMKAQLRSVRPQNTAGVYMRQGSFVLTTSQDRFLYRTVTKTPRPKNNSTGGTGGSRIRISSSGRSHGGARGRF